VIEPGTSGIEAMRAAGEEARRAVELLVERLGELEGMTGEEGLSAADSIEWASTNIIRLIVQELLPAIGKVRLAAELIEAGVIDALPGIGYRRQAGMVGGRRAGDVEPVDWDDAFEAEPEAEAEALPGIGHQEDEA
jgi:hypothetical protein